MNQSAKILWFDKLKGIGEAQSLKNKKIIFINSNHLKKPEESFNLNEGTLISCRTKKNEQSSLFGLSIKLKHS